MPNAIDKAAYFSQIGYAPHAKQLLYHNSEARFKAAVCGRRFGKSKMVATDIEPELLLPKRRYWIVGPTYDLGEKEFRVIWDDMIIGLRLGDDKKVRKSFNLRDLALDTPILTTEGWTTMAAIKIGQEVFDERGVPCNVVGKSEVFTNSTCYKVKFNDGSTLIAGAGHKWAVETPQIRYAKSQQAKGRYGYDKVPAYKVVTTQELLERPWMKSRKQYRSAPELDSVAVTLPLQMVEQKVPVDPYVYGVWLGDGASDGTMISCDPSDAQIMENIRTLGYEVHQHSNPNRWTALGLKADLRANGMLGKKVVHSAYWLGSEDQRLALLQGLMDTDGTVDAGMLRFDNTNQELLRLVEWLVTSLGGRTTRTSYINNIGVKCWKVRFSVSFPCFRLSRKLDSQVSVVKTTIRSKRRFIKQVTPIPTVPTQCISVDSPSHLFLATHDLIATHNTGDMYIEFPWQTRIEVKTAHINPEKNLVGEGLDGVIISEAAKHNPDVWNRFIRPALSDKRGWASFVTTPEGFNWLYEIWRLGKDTSFPDYESWRFPSWENNIIYPGGRIDPEILLLERTLSKDEFDQEIAALFTASTGRIYGEFDEDIHCCNYEYNPNWPNYMGIDWGFSHPLAAIEFQVSPSEEVYVWREYYRQYQVLEACFDEMQSRNQPEGYRLDYIFGDAEDPEATLRTNQKFGPCLSLPAAKRNWRQGVDLVKKFLKPQQTGFDIYERPVQQPHLFVSRDCPTLIREFTNYKKKSSKVDIRETTSSGTVDKKDDHGLDALRYGLMHLFELGVQEHLVDVVDANPLLSSTSDEGSNSGFFTIGSMNF